MSSSETSIWSGKSWLQSFSEFLEQCDIQSLPFLIRIPLKITVIAFCCTLYVSIGLMERIKYYIWKKSVKTTGSTTSVLTTTLRFGAYLIGMCDDYMAYTFLPFFPYQLYVFVFILSGWAMREYAFIHMLAARTCWGDDAIKKNKDIEQIVILGAGNDTRLHRMADLPDLLFEVDAPFTQEFKIRKFKNPNPKVKFVSVNFEMTSWLDECVKAGFDKSKKTLFIWEGVTYYLTESAIRDTLKNISECANGSKVLFDYGSYKPGNEQIKKYLQSLGEPWISDFSLEAIISLLAEYNMKLDQTPFYGENYARTPTKKHYVGKIARPSGPAYGVIHFAIATIYK